MPELFPEIAPAFAADRESALRELDAFIPAAGRYGRERNHLVPGHTNVSRLSPAIRHRLILEDEAAAAPLKRYAPSTVEKFTQEVYWRRYWKAWLSLRPQVWTDYLSELESLRERADAEMMDRVTRCESGNSPVAIMNHFARELIETGYLHNHARMWFAGWWIHVERLPWQLGADFFFRHLLDGDPASNTLSWRWVAGLQTPGKTYLPRRSNLEKYLPPEWLEEHADGLDQLEGPSALIPSSVAKPEITQRTLPGSPAALPGRVGIWLHEEDLFIEGSPLAEITPVSIFSMGDHDSWDRFHHSETKTHWIQRALSDAARRAESKWSTSTQPPSGGSLPETLVLWARHHELTQVAAIRPDIGPLNDQIPALHRSLQQAGVSLRLIDRPEDLALRPLATGGFFGFWKKLQKAQPSGATRPGS